jgi:ribose transport system substrate-binding protein
VNVRRQWSFVELVVIGMTFVIILGGIDLPVASLVAPHPLIPADITCPPSLITAGIHIAASNLRDADRGRVGKFMPRHLMIDVELITPENAKRSYFPESVY